MDQALAYFGGVILGDTVSLLVMFGPQWKFRRENADSPSQSID
jgi:hypothetical protein